MRGDKYKSNIYLSLDDEAVWNASSLGHVQWGKAGVGNSHEQAQQEKLHGWL